MDTSTPHYLHGFGNHFATEAIPGVLIPGRNSPQQVAYGLYAEQLSGSAFTVPRQHNLKSWLYRIRPSVLHGEFTAVQHAHFTGKEFDHAPTPPTQMRWDPLPDLETKTDFIQGMVAMAGNGHCAPLNGAAIYLYSANTSMQQEFFYNADGDFLIVPQEGALRFKTELGILDIKPGEIAVLPRGIKYQVQLLDNKARGYICENFGAPFRLPELGIIGANGLANPRDFQYPIAAYEERQSDFKLLVKFQGQLWSADIQHSPLDVVAWQGNYAPYKYDLSYFNTINSVSFDHPDPSIFTVLSSPTNTPGVANVDFVIFPPRWIVAENTFRPPYYHRNIMNEFMGLIHGVYDAKETGFVPGGSSLHNCMSAHGPDADAFDKATRAKLMPQYYDHNLAFMFESSYVWQVSHFAQSAKFRQRNYLSCWQGLTSHFQAPSFSQKMVEKIK